MFRLVAVAGPLRGMSVPILAGSVIVGRRRSCEIVLPSGKVSRLHCLLMPHRDVLYVQDLNSTNGTFVNGKRIERGDLQPGDTLTIAEHSFALERIPDVRDEKSATRLGKTHLAAPAPTAAPLSVFDGPAEAASPASTSPDKTDFWGADVS